MYCVPELSTSRLREGHQILTHGNKDVSVTRRVKFSSLMSNTLLYSCTPFTSLLFLCGVQALTLLNSPLLGLLIRSVRLVLAGQHCTDYISNSAVRSAPSLLHWSAQYATLAVIFKATANRFLYVDD